MKAGSGALTFGHPSSAGVPAETASSTVVLDYNDMTGVTQAFSGFGQEIAAVIVEPVAGNMNLVAPNPGFLPGLRELCTRHGSVLIFDEVMTGFRVGLKCAQGLYGIKPDLTTLGKVIGGGMPMAAFGGRRDIMQCLAPRGRGVSGRHAFRQSGRGRCWTCHTATGTRARILRQAFCYNPATDRRPYRSRERARNRFLRTGGGGYVRPLFPE